MKLDLVSASVVSLLVAASVTLIACPRKPEPPDANTPEVIGANTTPPTTPPTTSPGGAESKGVVGDVVNKVFGKKVALKHREKGEQCSQEKVAGNADGKPAMGDGYRPARDGNCAKDADCKAGKNGRCSMIGGGRLPPYPGCVYDACYVDADCGAKKACNCGGSASDGHSCEQGNCAVDADCGTNGYCSPSFGSCGNYGGVIGNFCHTSKDECTNDDECMGKPGGYCGYSQEAGKWQCSYGHCVG